MSRKTAEETRQKRETRREGEREREKKEPTLRHQSHISRVSTKRYAKETYTPKRRKEKRHEREQEEIK